MCTMWHGVVEIFVNWEAEDKGLITEPVTSRTCGLEQTRAVGTQTNLKQNLQCPQKANISGQDSHMPSCQGCQTILPGWVDLGERTGSTV